VTFGESLARQRDRAEGEGEEFRLTPAQREEAESILADVATGREGKAIRAEARATSRAEELAEHVRVLRERKKAVEDELAAATEELVREVGEGATVASEHVRVRVGIPRLTVRVKDKRLLPEAFFSAQPDRTKILAHVRETAEVPEGTEVAETKPTVYLSVPKGGDAGDDA